MSSRRALRTIDLFAGAGGLTLGFHQASTAHPSISFETVFAVEHDHAAALTYKTNFGVPVHDGDIEMFNPDAYPEAEIIIGGPPCQGFSPLGKNRNPDERAALNSLWKHYLTAVRKIRPLAFVIENVPQFQRSAQFNELLHQMANHEDLQGYQVAYSVLNAAAYGVPQSRRRGFLIASRVGELAWPPKPTHGPDCAEPHRTTADAIADLAESELVNEPFIDESGLQHLHIRRNPTEKSMARYRAIPPGGNRFDLQANRPDLTPNCWKNKPTGTTDVMGRMWWDRPSPTIRTEFYKPEKGRYLHPELDRPITHREAARLQTFPDNYIFEGSKVEIARQIGNAVPPALGKAIALHLANTVNGT